MQGGARCIHVQRYAGLRRDGFDGQVGVDEQLGIPRRAVDSLGDLGQRHVGRAGIVANHRLDGRPPPQSLPLLAQVTQQITIATYREGLVGYIVHIQGRPGLESVSVQI